MEKQEFKSKWDELAREIGAEVSPEIEQREQVVSTTASDAGPPQPSQPAETAAKVLPPLPKRAADWDSLAGELGLPPIESPAPASEEDRPGREEREPPRQPPPRRPQRERSDRRESSEPRREPRQPRREPRREDAPRESRREAPPRAEAPPRVETPPRAEVPPKAEAPPPVPQREEPTAPPPTVSLWHKIFGSPTEQSAKLTETPTRSDEADTDLDVRDEPPSRASSSSFRSQFEVDEVSAEFVEVSDRGDAPDLATDESEPSERNRGRPRRRRRGGRGRRPDDRPAEGRRPAPRESEPARARDVGDEFDDIREPEPEDDLDGLDDSLDATGGDFDDSDDLEDATTASGRSKSAAPRAIPSWDEAIGFIVDSNMQSRSQRRPPSRGDLRGNSPRGRTRGRRK